jgi:hypothetical protein
MLHGGSFFKKRPPWPPEAITRAAAKEENMGVDGICFVGQLRFFCLLRFDPDLNVT